MSVLVDGTSVGSATWTGVTPETPAIVDVDIGSNGNHVVIVRMTTDTGASDALVDWFSYTRTGDIPAPRPAPVPATTGALASGVWRNLFAESGRSQAEIDAKVNAAWQQLFHGDDANQRIYFPVGTDQAYIKDVGNNDVRSEGMSYGMMISVQLDKKTEFDRLWRWASTVMRAPSGEKRGYFAWKCSTSGSVMDPNPASDGEIYFATALIFAHTRWGSTGPINYLAEARAIWTAMFDKEQPGEFDSTYNMFNATHKQVTFTPYGQSANHTDPSYHVPAFFEIWRRVDTDRASFWAECAAASRLQFRNAANTTTGLMPDYSNWSGTPYVEGGHESFRFDAWRCAMNVAMDHAWTAADPWQVEQSNRLLAFFASKGIAAYGNQWALNGTQLDSSHSPGLVAMNAVAVLASNQASSWAHLDHFWDIPVPSGQWRYYDGCLYLFGLLHCSGKFRAWVPESTPSAGTIALSTSTASIGEGGGSVTVTARRTGGSAGAVSVAFATANGSASAGSDYTVTSGTLSWAAGNSDDKTFVVAITQDAVVESGETFTATLSAPTGGATLGTPAAMTVTIVDDDGSARIPEDPTGTVPGIAYQSFVGSWLTLPDYSAMVPCTEGVTSVITLALRPRDERFGMRFSGCLDVPSTGTWTLSTVSDDGSRLWIGSTLVVENDGLHAAQVRSGSIALQTGRHALTVDFFNGTGAGVLDLRWQGPATALQAIPTSAYRRLPSPSSAASLSGLDIGSPNPSGSATQTAAAWTVIGGGRDIWNRDDSFHFASQSLDGDGEIVARVTGISATDPWSKAGVMIRASTAANSQHAMLAITSANGMAFQRRPTAGSSSAHTAGRLVEAPRWVRLVRRGSTFSGYESDDGETWNLVGSDTIAMPSSVSIGLAVTGHRDGTACSATFDHVRITTAPTGAG